MGVNTEYDKKRDYLKERLSECLELARELLDPKIWGYDEMKRGYDLEIYEAVRNARDSV